MKKQKIVVAVTGASGSIYAKLLIEKLLLISNQIKEAGLVFSKNAEEIWEYELGDTSYKEYSFKKYSTTDFYAPFASGSAQYDVLIICPCSMGTLGRIANGTSDDLITRAADVMLKERKKLILVPRELPYSLIHINNMKRITEAGGIICPASPSFYNKPKTLEDAVNSVINRILDLAGFEIESKRWGDE
ncbi:MAG: 3-octaprenyl-4-hydroxybenzoate carboxy-lyase [Bacteroidetes bacterium GWC2_33_15]|nr:MAG: 3-octaprenyl-4-hydroxybenzoate carboxy-lyase [Bacteroidetes bacterium GWA2_33_15]OFX52639.1 MAG: 3-octaprenyl-4-hydroxybenzoate carboxy-lyase [Bacteroidetes bacterium GWC2_33_15]OFX64055.1 MAG: 3-octaprenyl-4-hydroxybenzoate carboxy-lyase [Bacteroidetes bacterium GWB2_32_14]OFX67259.1 MAG: 3-octaprenyl-4-hydroxybenzoate carboxy-lyase [Bacteroidetes bacterium GWD2_33_33]HAN18883.1 3-octaprenyl-4-hydroxybenzoate carboxy-lyase [Bacteroidales bacterium]